MDKEEILKKIQGILNGHLNIGQQVITMKTTLVDDLSADSLDIVEIIMEIEEEFNIEIPDSDAEKIATVGDIVEYIEENGR